MPLVTLKYTPIKKHKILPGAFKGGGFNMVESKPQSFRVNCDNVLLGWLIKLFLFSCS